MLVYRSVPMQCVNLPQYYVDLNPTPGPFLLPEVCFYHEVFGRGWQIFEEKV
jgi:hypothetical protein